MSRICLFLLFFMPFMAWSATNTGPTVVSVQQMPDGIYTNGQYIQFNVILDQVYIDNRFNSQAELH